MPETIKTNTKPGELYLGEDGDLHAVHHFCTLPTATLESVTTGRTTGGAVGSRNLEPFTPIADLDRTTLVEIICGLSRNCTEKTNKIIDLTETVAELKNQIADIKLKELSKTNP